MRNRKIVLAGGASLVLALTTSFVGAAIPAQAADSSCEQGQLCVWEGPNYTGTKHVNPPVTCEDLGYVVRSAKNFTTELVSYWWGEGCIDSGSTNEATWPGEAQPSFFFEPRALGNYIA